MLLAYYIFIFASDYAVYFDETDNPTLRQLIDPYKSILPKFKERKIYVFAVKDKQVESLRFYWQEIRNQLSRIIRDYPALQQPVFAKWNSSIPDDCTILVVDEAHDLTINDQKTISNWIKNSQASSKFLLVACDRNQARNNRENNENIIFGLNFSKHSVRLNRIYRCPFPVYVASVGILFRWFAIGGANIELSSEKLREHFGFKPKIKEYFDSMVLSMRNDCHPGNNWNQTVGYFTNCTNTYLHLKQFPFEAKDVLWARFERQENEFDYIEIQRKYTFVDLTIAGAEMKLICILKARNLQ